MVKDLDVQPEHCRFHLYGKGLLKKSMTSNKENKMQTEIKQKMPRDGLEKWNERKKKRKRVQNKKEMKENGRAEGG